MRSDEIRQQSLQVKELKFISFYNLLQLSSLYQIWVYFLKWNGNLSQTLKPIKIKGASYCIQFEIGTETFKILRFNGVSQTSD